MPIKLCCIHGNNAWAIKYLLTNPSLCMQYNNNIIIKHSPSGYICMPSGSHAYNYYNIAYKLWSSQ